MLTPVQTPIKSPEKKKTRTMEPVEPSEPRHMDSLETQLECSDAESSLPTPRDLASSFEGAVAVESTPKGDGSLAASVIQLN